MKNLFNKMFNFPISIGFTIFVTFLFITNNVEAQVDSLGLEERILYVTKLESTESLYKNGTTGSAVAIDGCGTSFSTTSYGADNSGNCKGDPNFGGLWNDLDCNDDTGNGNGADVGYSVENDIYYYFCPQTLGNWEFTIEPSNCSGGNGNYQYAVFQGFEDSLHTLLDGGTAGMSIGGGTNSTITINVSNTIDCIYIQIDGYAGTECDYGITLENLDNPCVLPVTLSSFEVINYNKSNELSWTTASETNNDYFIVEYSSDGKSWSEIQKVQGAGNSNSENTYLTYHRDYEKEINYYRLKQVDYDGTINTHNIISIDNTGGRVLLKKVNSMGQEVNDNYKGMVIEYYEDGSTRKVMQ